MSAGSFSRRSLLAGAGSTAVVLGAGALEACSSDDKPSGGGQASAPTTPRGDSGNQPKGGDNASSGGNKDGKSDILPTFKPYEGVTPDSPTSVKGSLAVFFSYPRKHPKSVEKTPGTGGPMSSMVMTYVPAPPEPPGNKFWAELNKKLNVDLQVQITPNADYQTKFATTIAGSSLPDTVQVPYQGSPNLPQLLGARFADLSSYLSGDAVLDYPNLATLPTIPWQHTVYNDAIFGVPDARGSVNSVPFVRKDRFDAAKVGIKPESYEEFAETCKALTDASKRQWAFGPIGSLQGVVMTMVGAPNGWSEKNGKLTNSIETEEYADGVSKLIQLWKDGIAHPDAFSTSAQFKQWFYSATIAIAMDGYQAYDDYTLKTGGANHDIVYFLSVPKAEGGGLAKWRVGGEIFTMSAINKSASPDRIREILRVMDWLAAPFGTEENYYLTFGVEGVDHKIVKGEPALTDRGRTEMQIPLGFIVSQTPVLYASGLKKEHNLRIQKYMDTVIPIGMPNPVATLYSDTNSSKGPTLNQKVSDSVNAIVQRRQPFSHLKEVVSDWRSGGGDQIRKEYEEALQKSGD